MNPKLHPHGNEDLASIMVPLGIRKEVADFVRACELIFYLAQTKPEMTETERQLIAEYIGYLSHRETPWSTYLMSRSNPAHCVPAHEGSRSSDPTERLGIPHHGRDAKT
jgi:hypothetical protein